MFKIFKKNIVGIDISDYSIELLKLSPKKEVLSYNRLILPKGIVRNGVILDEKALALKLKKLVKTAKGVELSSFGRVGAVVSLPESQLFIGDEKMIPWQEAEVYSAQLGTLKLASPKKIVDAYRAVFRKAGIALLVLEAEPLSLARALLTNKKAGPVLLADMGERTINLSIFDDSNQLKLALSINSAGRHFTKAIAGLLKTDRKKAEQMKKEYGFDSKKPDNKVLPILQSSFQKIVKEFNQLISFYQERETANIEEIILAGGSSLLSQVDEYLALNTSKKVRLGNPLKQLKQTKRLKRKNPKDAVLYSNVIGLALRAVEGLEKGVNLISEEPLTAEKALSKKALQPKKRIFKVFPKKWFLFGFGFAVGLWAVWFSNKIIFKQEEPFQQDIFIPRVFSTTTQPIDPYLQGNVSGFSTTSDLLTTSSDDIIKELKVLILETPTGWLNVRSGPGLDFEVESRVYPGENYVFLQEKDGWYEIELSRQNNGWIFSQYAQKVD